MELNEKLIEAINEYKSVFGKPCPIYNLYGKSNEEVINAIRSCIEKGEELKSNVPKDAVI